MSDHFSELGRWHFIVGERIFQRAFAKLRQIGQGRESDIGSHAVQLGRATGDAIKFLDGQLERAIILVTGSEERSEAADLEDRLHGAFAESLL